MNTFLPYPDFRRSAKVLDRQRLGKQRLEVYQLLRALIGDTKGWKNHPAVKMWTGHERALGLYGLCICREWRKRKYVDNMHKKIYHLANQFIYITSSTPKWFGNDGFHAAHRAALLFKNPVWYKQFRWKEKPKIDYYWPKPKMKIIITTEEFNGDILHYIDNKHGEREDWRSFNKTTKSWTVYCTVLTNDNYNFKTLEEANAALKEWFATQPEEVFAEYIAERMRADENDE